MKVYCVWAWDQYYPDGANGNLKGIYADADQAEVRASFVRQNYSYDRVSVTNEIVQDV